MDFSFIMPYPNTHAHLDAFLAESWHAKIWVVKDYTPRHIPRSDIYT